MEEAINEEKIKLAENYINKFNNENNEDIINMLLDWIINNNIKFNESEIVFLINNDDLLKRNIENTIKDNKINSKSYTGEKSNLYISFLEAYKLVEEMNDFDNKLYDEKELDVDMDCTSDNLISYCLSVSPKRTLTKEEVADLCKKYQNGSLEARNILMSHNFRLVFSIAKDYQNLGLDIEDLFQAGCEGLINAIEKFNYKLGFAFSTYAVYWIKQSITRTIANESRTIRVPVLVNEEISLVKRTIASYYTKYGLFPSEEEIAQITNKPINRVKNALFQIRNTMVSLSTPINDDEDCVLGDVIVDEDSILESNVFAMENNIFYKEVGYFLENSKLTEREKAVIKYRFGFYDGKCYKLEEIGKTLGVTRERVRQIEMKSLRKLKLNHNFKNLGENMGFKTSYR